MYESFFSDMMTGSRSLSEKQRSWFVSIISQQIKPFVLEHVEESMSLDMSDLNDTVLEI